MEAALARPREAFFRWRDRLIASEGFQRWAARFPLTRRHAARQSRALFDLCAGFVYSQVLAACVELDLFRRLAVRPARVEELALATGLDADAMRRLLRAAASLGLLTERAPELFGLGVLGAALNGNPGVIAMIRHHRMLYADLADPVALLRGRAGPTQLSRFWAYAGSDAAPDAAAVAEYSALMAASQSFILADALECYPFARHRLMMDVGGGEGVFAAGVARHAPEIAVRVLDLPEVAARANLRFVREGLAARAEAIGGDAIAGPLPQGADLITFVRVLHDHDDAPVAAMLRNAHAALAPGGALLIIEPMAGISGVEPVGDAYFGLYLLAMGSGRARRPTELAAMLAAAGFEAPQQLPTRRPLMTSAMVARKPPMVA